MKLFNPSDRSKVKIEGKIFQVEDAIEYITLADSFVKNKIGVGHGEGKLYIGQTGRPEEFFGDFNSADCFLMKQDFLSFLNDAKDEYINPQQDYVKKEEMQSIFLSNYAKVMSLTKTILHFQIYRVNVAPPRVYINSNSKFFTLIREIGLPNISYLSILKLKNILNDKISFYFRIFIDYKADILHYSSPEEKRQIENIENSVLPKRKKQILTTARIGQGEYRTNVLEECPYCPFTMVNDERLLIASHIKPWAASNDDEKIDPKNGFALTPTFDRLFDQGFISFEDDKTLLVSPWLSPMNQKRLGIYSGKLIDKLPLDEKRKKYLLYHRKNIFKS